MKETEMSEYIAGFNDGYAYVLQEIERHPGLTIPELLTHLKGKGENIEEKIQNLK